MSRMIDADKLSADMYHEAFEKDSDMQKWDSGCWIRYKMFENVLKAQPTMDAPDINVGNMDTTTHESIPAETGENYGDRTSGDCISRQQAIYVASGYCHPANVATELAKLPSAQSEQWTLLKKAKFEYDEAWRIITHPTPDVTYADKNRARIILDTFKDSLGMLNELPPLQPEIIHCKDCKYWTHIKRTNRYWCKTDNGLFDLNPSPDDFCSRAERREDGQTD